ncbi:MAG: hypothetical protein LBR25_03635 [Erysipelotrichaceae bacterium]|jgi:hypothetical protein|nr:hypothetical protein [Erysipelotrichaceae bacterium]
MKWSSNGFQSVRNLVFYLLSSTQALMIGFSTILTHHTCASPYLTHLAVLLLLLVLDFIAADAIVLRYRQRKRLKHK